MEFKLQLCSSLILDLLPVPNLHAQTLRVNPFETSQCAQLSLIKQAEVWSSGESRVDYLKHPPTHHAPKLHT